MKPSLPKGTRDFGPLQIRKRNYIFDIIRNTFEVYGYQPIETPAMENLSTLTGKYGDEGDQLLFKILNNGDYLVKANTEALSEKDSKKLLPSISKRGLRYDLTVPFARFLSMNRNELSFPFKRYQIQPVWRADRPQKGRFQEFYQCDADIAGSTSLVYEAELIEIYDKVFAALGLNVKIRLNHRKLLQAFAEYGGLAGRFSEFTTALDKWDKTGETGFREDLKNLGASPDKIDLLIDLINSSAVDERELQTLAQYEIGKAGLDEIAKVRAFLDTDHIKNEVVVDLTLARGLSYYTGCVLEVESKDAKMGSIGGGGRYDDLTGVFGFQGVSGVGISFGAERIYEIMEELQLFPDLKPSATRILFLSFDEEDLLYSKKWQSILIRNNIAAEIYPEPAKLKKQFKYADGIGVPFVAIVGKNERENNTVQLKDQKTGEQRELGLEDLVGLLG